MTAAGEVERLVPERVWQETERALGEARPEVFFETLRACGALAVIFPELDALFGVPQPPRWHPEVDTGVHVMLALRYAADAGAPAAVRFAVLTHDLGKARTPRAHWPSHHGHEEPGVPLIEALCERLKVPNGHRELAVLAARHHTCVHRAGELEAGDPADAARELRRLPPPRALRGAAARLRGRRPRTHRAGECPVSAGGLPAAGARRRRCRGAHRRGAPRAQGSGDRRGAAATAPRGHRRRPAGQPLSGGSAETLMSQGKLRVGIVFGGRSTEHEISILSARNILAALDRSRYEPVLIGIDKSGRWLVQDPARLLASARDPRLVQIETGEAAKMLAPGFAPDAAAAPLDVVFPVLHGTLGEDGAIQGLLEVAGIPYVGAGILGSAIGMDKDVTKRLLREAAIAVADFRTVRRVAFEADPRGAVRELAVLGFPVFIKPANAGSSVGIRKVSGSEELAAAIRHAFSFDSKVIVEAAVTARELELAVLGGEPPRSRSPARSSCGTRTGSIPTTPSTSTRRVHGWTSRPTSRRR